MTAKKPPMTPDEIAAALAKGEEALKDDSKLKKAVDITDQVHPLAMHLHMSIPKLDVTFALKGSEIEFMLTLFSRVHQTLMEDIRNEDLHPDDRNRAYQMALNVERIYGSVFEQLKLNKPLRPDLH